VAPAGVDGRAFGFEGFFESATQAKSGPLLGTGADNLCAKFEPFACQAD
jgi:hypothetical protein